jgi:hypothetical protein
MPTGPKGERLSLLKNQSSLGIGLPLKIATDDFLTGHDLIKGIPESARG